MYFIAFFIGSLFDPILLALVVACAFVRGWYGVAVAVAGSLLYGVLTQVMVNAERISHGQELVTLKIIAALFYTGCALGIGHLVRRARAKGREQTPNPP